MSRSGPDDAARPGPCMDMSGRAGADALPALRDLSRQAVAHALGRAQARTVAGGAENGAPWPVAVDGTAGNGHDTLFLARLVGARGVVHAFDVQPGALARTAERLAAAGLDGRVALHGRGHEELAAALAAPLVMPQATPLTTPDTGGVCPPCVTAAMFNLGFLPGSDRSVITRPDTTLAALDGLLPLLAPGGVVSLHVYAGHPGGADEAAALDRRLAGLDWDRWRVARYEFANKPRNPERLLLVSRLPDPA
ncbi:tRNA (mnm(5)s(2)U34)-methyltransferase [Nitratidesulfovibrio sp. 1201_IL3209]|uniref:tRNA (mnm(5)s(2)U34)-methyltransferase n=1 Tax=Nitratidesulfovibrio sp. 1201_IL3209 TaxID=3084053 RepID=UPI002FD8FC7B